MAKEFHQKPLSNLEIAEFCNQMHMLLSSGISPMEALTLLSEDCQSEAEHLLLLQMLENIESTGILHESMTCVQVFPDYVLHMTKLGEDTGTLDDVMQGLSEHYIREENLAGMIRSALIYPSIMLGMMLLIVIVLLTKVMPIFNQVFQQLGQELSGFSAGLLTLGETLSNYSFGIVIGIAILICIIFLNRKHLPFQNKMQEKIAACRFADGMSIALKSGLTPEAGLELTADLIDSSDFVKKIQDCSQQLESGMNLGEALRESQILKGSYARIALIAEKSGMLDEAMSQISSEYEYEINSNITHKIALIEPTLVIILSFIVGIILFSVMLPLLGIMSGL